MNIGISYAEKDMILCALSEMGARARSKVDEMEIKRLIKKLGDQK